ncbi:hypothetical protein FH972_025538 [Carpinus fangiana]|uniref:Ubiquitin carboxyl-terminal hydrolase n=1 Tax=Carpinus fangiana TaxID=176857 RepID=A0A5N6L1K6_9ROSI|nr:hypothetical protein FH972_025538 [Carpinus fangiana]
MSTTRKKRRLNNGAAEESDAKGLPPAFPGSALSSATPADKSRWQGFCEIDSDPAYFSVMLEEFGVRGIRVREVYSLDADILAFLPRPIHGLIFLFKYRADDATKQEASCPDHVWFANQTHDQACATVALLNIVNNIDGADLGEHLQSFRDFTDDFTPALRGDAIGSFEFVKNVHNSFARKMDMLNIDLARQNAYDDRNKKRKKPTAAAKSKGSKKKGVITDDDYDEEENGYHFIAFVPIGNEVWKMDGLERQPVKLGTLGSDEESDWLSLVLVDLGERMAQFEANDINFNLLACVQDPLVGLHQQLREQTRAIQAVEKKLDEDRPRGWRRDDSNQEADIEIELAGDDNENTGDDQFSTRFEQRIHDAGADGEALFKLRQALLGERRDTLAAVAGEEAEAQLDRDKAAERRHDFGPLIHAWLRMLAEKEGVVKSLIEETS